MSKNQRPWWVFALQMPLLNTTLQEEGPAEQRRFIITGQPVLRSLHWVTLAPALAVLSMAAIGGLAWFWQIKAQPDGTKILFVCLLVSVPIAVWVFSGLLLGKLTGGYIKREVQANTRHVKITIDRAQQVIRFDDAPPIPFGTVQAFSLITDTGTHYTPNAETALMHNLVIDTTEGLFTLLPKELGSVQQKLQLVSRIKPAIGLPD